MKRYLSFHLFAFFSCLGFIGFLTGCTLYMDDPEDLRVLRTEEGYLEPATVDLPGEQGTITYQYNQKTIPIDDEVDQWIVRVEQDSILFFSKDTPEFYLPEVDEMMTCSFRDKFPHGFLHRCIERTETGDAYRCVFTKCGLADAFTEFHCEFDTDDEGYVIDNTPEEYKMTEEEFDSLMNAPSEEINYDTDDEADESRLTRGDQPATRLEYGDKEWHNKSINWTIPELDLDLEKKASAGGYADATSKCNIKGGHLKMSAGIKGYLDIGLLSQTVIFGVSMSGDFNMTYESEISAGSTIKCPFVGTPFGFALDLVVVSLELGLTVQPYFTTQHVFGVEEGEIGFKFDYVAEFEKSPTYPKGKWKKVKRGSSRPKCKSKFKKGTSEVLDVEAGLDCRLGAAGDIEDVGVEFAIGKKIFAKLQANLTQKEFFSAEEYAEQNANFVTYEQNYLTANIGVAVFSFGGTYNGEEQVSKRLKIPFFPVTKSSSFYCEYGNSKTNYLQPMRTYHMKASLSEPGLITSLLGYKPQMRLFKNKVLFHTFDLSTKFKDGWTDYYYLHYKDDNHPNYILEENVPYTVQFGYLAYATWTLEGDNFWIPLQEIPYEIVHPKASISKKPKLQASQSADKQNNKKPWVKGGVNYKYRYVIDTEVQIDHAKDVDTWGLDMSKNNGSTATFTAPKKKLGVTTAKKTVRMYWYSNDTSVQLQAESWCKYKDENNVWNPRSATEKFVVSYSSSKDTEVSSTVDYDNNK